MTGVLYRLAQFCIRRRVVVLGVWLVVAIALVAISHRLGDNTNDNLSLPGTEQPARDGHARRSRSPLRRTARARSSCTPRAAS